ncbi:MAG: hypothetical protein HYX66_05835 [Ignavibacteria bacterium]|nr:hypothetical protein [Ignavibacteria bacterium]
MDCTGADGTRASLEQDSQFSPITWIADGDSKRNQSTTIQTTFRIKAFENFNAKTDMIVEHDHPSLGHYYRTNMEIEPNHKMQGIGTEILKRHKQQYGLSIRAAENDGQRRDDGSHLTGDAPGFVSRMKERGLIECEPNDFNPDDDLG